MNDKQAAGKKSYTLPQKIVRVFVKTIIGVLALFILIILLIQTPPVQNFARKKIQTFLANKLQTRVEIGHLYIGLPKKIVLQNIYLEDRQKDTLLSGGKVKVDIDLFKLFSNEIVINEINLESVTAKVKRMLPDTVFNFQFIVDAFTPAKQPVANADTAAMKMAIDYVTLDKIRLIYKDVITGNDMDLWLGHFDSRIKTFDPTAMNYNVPTTHIRGVRAKVYQSKPLMVAEPLAKDAAQAAAPIPINFAFGEMSLEDIEVDYRNDVSAFYTTMRLGDLVVHSNNLDLKNRVIDLQDITLNELNTVIRLGRKEAAKVAVKEIKKEVELEAQNDWRIVVGSIRLNNNSIQLDDDNKPKLRTGMDYAHMKAEQLTLHVNNLLFSKDSAAGEIIKGTVKEKSGFNLKTLETEFLYAHNQAYLHNLLIETPGSVIRRSAELKYPSIAALQSDFGKLQLDIDLDDTRIQVRDILVFAPDLRSQPAFANPNAVWRANGNVTGSIANLNFSPFQLSGLQNTRLDISGNISGLPDINQTRGNLVIRNLQTGRRDIMLLTPRGTIPPNITIPESIRMQGTVKGGVVAMNTNLQINTSLGNASVNGTIQNLMSPSNLEYNVKLGTRNLRLGTILQNEASFGAFSADLAASGKGVDPKYATAKFNGIIHSAYLNKYNYKNVRLDGSLANQRAVANIDIKDPNIDLTLKGSTDLSSKFPSIHVDAFVDSLKTKPLQLTPQSVYYHGRISADFPVTDPANLQGELLVTESVLVNEGQRITFDSIYIQSGNSDSGHFVRVQSDAVNMLMVGQYNLMQLATVFQDAIQPYFAILPTYKPTVVDPYDFTLKGTIVNHPTLAAFVPDLERLDAVTVDARFSSTNGWEMNLFTPLVIYDVFRLEGVRFNAATRNGAIVFETELAQFNSGTAMHIYQTKFSGSVANNQIDFNLNIKDKIKRDKYQLAGLFKQPQKDNYSITLQQDSLLLNYDRWTVNNDNTIHFGTNGVYARNFILSRNNESLSINSLTPSGSAPVEVKFSNFRIGTILGFIQPDTLLADGSINGNLVLNNLMTQPTFTSDLTVNNLTVRSDTVGDLRMRVNNTIANTYNADVTLTGQGNDLQLAGTYNVRPANNSFFDLNLDIRQLQLKSLEGASMGAYYNGSGYLKGKFVFNGTFKDPNIDGTVSFVDAGFTPAALGSHFTIQNENITVINNEGIRFNTFTVHDSLNNTLVLNGMAYTTNFSNYQFDMTLRANNFQALNTVRTQGALYWGQLFFSTNLRILGTEQQPIIDGSVTVNEDTKLTVVLPQTDVGLVDREGIVEFIDMDSMARDSVFLVYDTLNKSSLVGFDVAANIEINREAELSIIVDAGTGDFIRMRGEGLLTGGIDPSGKITLSGSYEIEEGAYELSFNFLKRKFLLQKGSKIIWTGEPTDAELSITAIYVANTSPLDLVENQLGEAPTTIRNTYRQKLPFEVYLKLNGPMMLPEISFDIVLPEKNYGVANDIVQNVTYRLDQIRQEPSELNKQVFALLLLNRFVDENPFQSSGEGGGGLNAGTLARQSVSKLLTEQLNQLAENLIQGVDINFDLVTTEDYTTGRMQNRTDFNVALSKRLLDDRLTVTVGSNFELEGPQKSSQNSGSNLAGNIAVDYQLTPDGRYRIRAYRRNEYEAVVEGYVVETGVSFGITLDYNRFKELFRKRRRPADRPPTEPNKVEPKVTTPEPVSKTNE